MPPKHAQGCGSKRKRQRRAKPDDEQDVDEDAFEPLSAEELDEHAERLELLKRRPKDELLRMINVPLFPRIKLAGFKGMSPEELAPALLKVALSETHKASVRVPLLRQLEETDEQGERRSNAQAHLLREAGVSSYTAEDGITELAKAGEEDAAKMRLEARSARRAERLRALRKESREEEDDD